MIAAIIVYLIIGVVLGLLVLRDITDEICEALNDWAYPSDGWMQVVRIIRIIMGVLMIVAWPLYLAGMVIVGAIQLIISRDYPDYRQNKRYK